MKRVTNILVLVILGMIFASCNGKIGLEEILASSTCEAPCWMDIIPGKTTQEEAHSKINMMADLVDKDSIFTRTYASKPEIGWKFLDSELGGWINFENEKVSSILIGDPATYRDRYGVRLDRIIELFGVPTDIYYTVGGGDIAILRVFVMNRENGMWCMYTQPMGEKLFVSPDQVIVWIEFFDPNDYMNIIFQSIEGDVWKKNHFNWTGFTEIEVQ